MGCPGGFRLKTQTPLLLAGVLVLEPDLKRSYRWADLDGSGEAVAVTAPTVLASTAGLASGFLDVDAAFEEGAIFDADARRGHVAGQCSLRANIDPVGGGNIAAHLAHDDDFARGDVGGHLAVAADGDTIAGKGNGAFDFAVNKQRLRAGDLTLEEQGFADGSLVAGRGRSPIGVLSG
jgi:hypothetical protein